MSRLDELIQQHCPDGVEYRKLEDCCTVLDKKRKPVTKAAREAGEYPYYGANGIQDYVSDYIFDGTFVLVGEDGSVITKAGTPVVTWAEGKIWVNNHAHIIEETDGVLLRYLFHYIQTIDVTPLIHGNIPKLTGGDFKALQIPVPPLPVQSEIVRILDNFTELTAELTARKKQYEFYRDKLLTFGDVRGGTSDVAWRTLGEVIVSLNTGLNPRQFFKLNTDDACNYYVTIREIQNGTIVFSDRTDKINDAALELCNNRSNLEVGDVLFSGTGTIGETAVISKPPINWNIKEGVYVIKPRKDLLNSRFLMYILRTDIMKTAIAKKVAGGTVKSIPMAEMRKLQLPVPSLQVQERLVNVLDNFDAICSDLNIGLPAEIEARKKQYEFYRDALLTYAATGKTILTDRQTDRQTDEYSALIRLCQYVFGYIFLPLCEVSSVFRGEYITKKSTREGNVPVILGGQEPAYYIDKANHTGEIVVIARSGASAGFVSYWNQPIFVTDGFGYERNELTTTKYLYYALKNIESGLNDMKRGAGVPHVSGEALGKILLPIPSIAEQNRIVSILDRFDALCNDLSSGLPAEIEARQKQYEYYRDKLLAFEDIKR